MNRIPNIALVGNAPKDKYEVLNAMLGEEDLGDICRIALYGADGQPEQEALADAIDDWRDGEIDGIVCLPMAQSPRKTVCEHFPEDADGAVMLYINDAMVLASVKGDVAAADAASSLTQESVMEKVQQTAKALMRDLMVLNPRIAVLSLNAEMKADETSAEIAAIAPAVSELVKGGVQTFGPLKYTEFFCGESYKSYDAVVEMYDSQCMEDHEKAGYDETVILASHVSAPIAFAKPEGILKAAYAVMDAAKNRVEYDRPFRNPLQKLYHERKEDGDKARFAVKKKGFNPAEHRRENVTFVTAKTQAPAAPAIE